MGKYVQGLSENEVIGIVGISSLMSSLSIIGSLFILFCYWRFPHLRKLTFTLVSILSFTDILNQLFDLITPSAHSLEAMLAGTEPVSTQCYVQALFDNFFELSSILWTTAIAATLHMTVMWRWTLRDDWRTLGMFAAFCYGIPFVLTLLPLTDAAYGPSNYACWIVTDKVYWEFITLWIPLWLAIAFNCVIYFRVLALLRLTVQTSGDSDATAASIRSMMKRLLVYPFILILCWFFESINAIVTIMTREQYFALSLIGTAFACSQGLLNSFAYGFSGGVQDALRDVLAPYCKCIKPSAEVNAARALTEPAAGGGAADADELAIGVSENGGEGGGGLAGKGERGSAVDVKPISATNAATTTKAASLPPPPPAMLPPPSSSFEVGSFD